MTSSARFSIVDLIDRTTEIQVFAPEPRLTADGTYWRDDRSCIKSRQVEISLKSNGPVPDDILLKLTKLFEGRHDGAELIIHGDSAS